MGNTSTKDLPPPERSPSKRRKSKIIHDHTREIRAIRFEIESKYEPHKNNDYHRKLQLQAEQLQEFRRTTKKSEQIAILNSALKEINDCIQILKDKEREGEEAHLELATVESTSFISQDVKKLDRESRQPSVHLERLSEIERITNALENEIRDNANGMNQKKMQILKKKTEILGRDIQKLSPPETPDLKTKHEILSGRISKMNKKITQTGSIRKSNEDAMLVIVRIEQDLSDLEVQALTFEDCKGDLNYKELNLRLRELFGALENLQAPNDDAKKRIFNAKTLIKRIINELEKKAVENEVVMRKELSQLASLRKEIQICKAEVEKFSGNSNGEVYYNLDQKLRALWSQLNPIGSFEKVKNEKMLIINEIKMLLKKMNEKGENQRPKSLDIDDLLKNAETLKKDWEKIQGRPLDLVKHASLHNILEDIEYSVKKTLKGTGRFEENRRIEGNKKIAENPKIEENRRVNGRSEETRRIEENGRFEEDQKIEKNDQMINNIREIDFELNQIQKNIESDAITDEEIQDEIEEQLLRYKHNLESMQPSNRIVENARERTLRKSRKINESFIEKINQPVISRPPSIHTLKETIIDIETRLGRTEASIAVLKSGGGNEESKKLKKDLEDYKNIIEGVDVRNFEDLWPLKINVLKYIERLEKNLSKKVEENDEKLKIKEILHDLQSLEKRIEIFQGVYKGEDYIVLESALNSHLYTLDNVKVSGKKLIKAVGSTKETIIKLLGDLEERSVKSNQVSLLEISKQNMMRLHGNVQKFSGDDGEYFQLIKEIQNCEEDLHSIPSGEIEKESYLDYLRNLKKYLNERTGRIEDPLSLSHSEINKIENDLLEINQKIIEFAGNKSDEMYATLDASLMKLAGDLNNINLFEDQEIMKKHAEIVDQLNKNYDLLEQRSKENSNSSKRIVLEEIQKIRRSVDDLSIKVMEFNGIKEDNDHIFLDEALLKLFLDLDRIEDQKDPEVKKMKREVLEIIKKNMKVLDDKVA